MGPRIFLVAFVLGIAIAAVALSLAPWAMDKLGVAIPDWLLWGILLACFPAFIWGIWPWLSKVPAWMVKIVTWRRGVRVRSPFYRIRRETQAGSSSIAPIQQLDNAVDSIDEVKNELALYRGYVEHFTFGNPLGGVRYAVLMDANSLKDRSYIEFVFQIQNWSLFDVWLDIRAPFEHIYKDKDLLSRRPEIVQKTEETIIRGYGGIIHIRQVFEFQQARLMHQELFDQGKTHGYDFSKLNANVNMVYTDVFDNNARKVRPFEFPNNLECKVGVMGIIGH